jgi:predicted phage terminase large subunit-like protein
MKFTPQEVDFLLRNLHKLPIREKNELLLALEELEKRDHAQNCRENLLEFIQHVDKSYKIGSHHRRLAENLEAMARGEETRLIVNIAPRFGKSMLVSIYFPAWLIGNNPDKKIMMVSHTADLAVDFGRKVRNLVASDAYKSIFPDVALSADSKSAGRWDTNKGGTYFAVGVGGAIAGRGADFLCIAGDERVLTPKGWRRADTVRVGDKIWGFAGLETVEKVFMSAHTRYVTVDGVKMTPNHPVWTHDAGWVRAESLTTHNLVDTVTFWAHGRLWYERAKRATQAAKQFFFAGVQHLADPSTAVQQPERAGLSAVWRAWHQVLRAVGHVRELRAGHGAASQYVAAAGADGYEGRLHAGELLLGGQGIGSNASPQWHQSDSVWEDAFGKSVGAGDGDYAGPTAVPTGRAGYDAGGSAALTEKELGAAPRSTDEFGWVRRAVVRVIGRCRQAYGVRQGFVVGCFEALIANHVFGLLLGVRRLRRVTEHWTGAKTYYNFQVSESNTFYVGGLLTHNCIDDPHNEQDVLNGNLETFTRAYEWYAYGARTRLMPGGRVAVVMTRWAQSDLSGKLLQDMVRNPEADQWNLIEFPALFEKKGAPSDAPENKRYQSLWPEQWSVDALLKTKASMPPFQWNAQYMQSPTSAEAAIIKREWWQPWDKDQPPACEYIIMGLDAAAEKHNRSDFTSLTTWGVFMRDGPDGYPRANLILLNAIKERWEFPTLKQRAYEEYKEWEPDWFVIEKKSSGTPLFQELRFAGVPVSEFTPHRGTGDKTVRLNSVADIFSSGLVWYPAGRRWAEDLIDEVCGFPNMEHDDQVDSTVMCLMRFRSGGFISLPTDRLDDDDFIPRRAAYY